MKRLNLRPVRPRGPRTTFIAWSALGVVLAAIAIASISVTLEHSRLAAQQQRLQREADALEAQAAAHRSRLALADQVRQALAVLRTSEIPRDLAARLEAAIPDGVWLTSLQLQPNRTKATGSGVRWQTIDGFTRALRAAGMAAQLESVSRESGKTDIYGFAITITRSPAVGAPR